MKRQGSALSYLLRRRAVNTFKGIFKKPGQLVTLILMIVFFAFFLVMFLSNPETMQPDEIPLTPEQSMAIYHGLAWLLISTLIIPTLIVGASKGADLFVPADVQFLFCAPYRPQTVLAYGMLSQLKNAFLSTAVIFFQTPNLINAGLSGWQIAVVFIGWFVVIVISQILAMALYVLAAKHPARRPLIKLLIWLIPSLVLGTVAVSILTAPDFPSGLIRGINAPWLGYIPPIGWLVSALSGLIYGMHPQAWIGIVLTLLMTAGALIYTFRTEVDYYEDAMNLAETMAAKKAKQMEAQVKRPGQVMLRTLKSEKIRKRGIGRGQGVTAIFWRQMLEYRRRRPFIAGFNMLFLTVGLGILARSLGSAGRFIPYLLILAAVVFDMFFYGGSSSFVDELEHDHFYYLPGQYLPKILTAMLSGLLYSFLDFVPGIVAVLVFSTVEIPFFLLTIFGVISILLLVNAVNMLSFRILGLKSGCLSFAVTMLLMTFFLLPTMAAMIVPAILSTTTVAYISYGLMILINLTLFAVCLPAGVSLLKNGPE